MLSFVCLLYSFCVEICDARSMGSWLTLDSLAAVVLMYDCDRAVVIDIHDHHLFLCGDRTRKLAIAAAIPFRLCVYLKIHQPKGIS